MGLVDNETKLIRKYQLERSECETDWDLLNLETKFPGLFYAEHFYTRDQEDVKWMIEARLLAGESYAEIADKLGCEMEAVLWYEKAFYNVQPKLQNRDYIATIAMKKSIHKGLYERDYDALWKLFGYTGGPHVLDAIFIKNTEKHHAAGPDQVNVARHQMYRANISHKATVASITCPVSYNEAAICDLYTRALELEKDAGGGADVQSMIAKNIHEALTSLPFSTERQVVVVPELSYYDEQSAELRADEQLMLAVGQETAEMREAVTITIPEAKDGDHATH